MADDRLEFTANRAPARRPGALGLALAEGLVALAQGALALVLGVLARVLSGDVEAAPNVGAMTSMSWFGARPIGSVTSHMSPSGLALAGLALVAARGAASTWLTRSEVRAAAGAAGDARRRILSAALAGGLGKPSLGAAIAWPHAIELGVRASRARRRAIVQLAVMALVTAALDPLLAGVVLATLVPFALLLRPIRRALRRVNQDATRGAVDTVDAVRDVVEHAAVWATCGAERTAVRRVAALNEDGAALSARAATFQSFSSTSNEVLAAIATMVLVAWFAPGSVVARPTLIPVLVLLVSTYRPLRDFAEAASSTARAEAAAHEIASLGRAETAVETDAGARTPWLAAPLRLEQVTLDVGGEAVRRGIDLVVQPGETLAIVGAPGTGKSALLEALVGVRPVHGGSIAHGSVPLSDRGLGPRHRPFAWVPPSPPVLPGTLAENLCPEAPEDEKRVARARAVLAELGEETLLTLSDDALLGPRGHRPSSGEAQRLALARTLAGDAPVVLLDEPTASLDALSESRAIEAIARHCRDRVVVLVTHRPAPLAIATRVLSLDDSRRGARDVVGAPKAQRRVTQ